jgi:hypothetical protein
VNPQSRPVPIARCAISKSATAGRNIITGLPLRWTAGLRAEEHRHQGALQGAVALGHAERVQAIQLQYSERYGGISAIHKTSAKCRATPPRPRSADSP